MRLKNKTGILLAALMLVCPVIARAENGRHAIVTEVRGNAEVHQKDTEWKAAEAGMILRETDEIRTGKGGMVWLLLDENGKTGNFELKPDSRIRLGTLQWDSLTGDKTTILELALGQVLVHAQKLEGKSKFEVKTPNSTTGVRGTTFLVSALPKKDK